MDFDELFALYWVNGEWNNPSDKENFAENSWVVNQKSTTVFSNQEVKKDDAVFQSWIHIQSQETIINDLEYPLEDIKVHHEENNYVEAFEYPLKEETEEYEEVEEIIEEEIIEEETDEDDADYSENNLFWKSVAGQRVEFPEEPKAADLISSASELSPLEALMGEDPDKKNEVTNDSNDDWYEVPTLYSSYTRRKHTMPEIWNPFKGAKFLSEVKIFIVLFLAVFSTFFFFTNAKLVMITVGDFIGGDQEGTVSLITWTDEHNASEIVSQKQEKLEELEESFQNIQKYKREEQDIALNMQDFLNKQQ